MVTVKDAKLGFGTVRFFGKIDPVPETVSRQGNVTIKNARQLAPMLRSFADEIEKLVAESEKQPDTTDQP